MRVSSDDSQTIPVPAHRFGETKVGRNTLYNLAGRILPMAVAVFTIPVLISELGVESFGVLTLLWMVVGYFGVFDLGIGRATTKFVAEAVTRGEIDSVANLVWTPLSLQLVLGIIGGGLLILLAPWLVSTVLTVPETLQKETLNAFRILGFSIPFILATSGARGVLEGLHLFGVTNGIRVPASIYTFVAPVVVAQFSHSLFDIAVALVIGRILVVAIHIYLCFRSVPGLRRLQIPSADLARTLLGYGGWLTVANIIGILMALGYVDRFFISTLLDMKEVAFYSTPFEAVNKLLLPVAGFLGVLFPMFSAFSVGNLDRLTRLYRRTIKIILGGMLVICSLLIAFSKDALLLWLGVEFANQATFILQLTAIGVLLSSLSSVPTALLQAAGRPDLTGKLVLAELPVYILICYLLTSAWGIVGTIICWLAWQLVHTLVLFYWGGSQVQADSHDHHLVFKAVGGLVVGMLIAFGLTTVETVYIRAILFCGVSAGMIAFVWYKLLDQQDRQFARGMLRRDVKAEASGERLS